MTDSARDRLQALVDEHYPFGEVRVDSASPPIAKRRKQIEHRPPRPAGTIAGPTLMALADAAVYPALQTEPVLVPDALTSQLTIHFLRKPAPRDVVVHARILRRGRTL